MSLETKTYKSQVSPRTLLEAVRPSPVDPHKKVREDIIPPVHVVVDTPGALKLVFQQRASQNPLARAAEAVPSHN